MTAKAPSTGAGRAHGVQAARALARDVHLLLAPGLARRARRLGGRLHAEEALRPFRNCA